MEKVIFEGDIGGGQEGKYKLGVKDGKVLAELSYDGIAGLEHLKQVIPGQIDDAIIGLIQAALKS